MWFCKFLPSSWLVESLKQKHGVYLVVLMNPEDGKTLVGGKHDGLFEMNGTLTYCISPMLLEAVFAELDKRMEVDRMIIETSRNPDESCK